MAWLRIRHKNIFLSLSTSGDRALCTRKYILKPLLCLVCCAPMCVCIDKLMKLAQERVHKTGTYRRPRFLYPGSAVPSAGRLRTLKI
jgi:hypothetical protein